MNSNVITLIGVVISAIISLIISRNTAKKEIEKMKLSWNREDEKAKQDEFADMVIAINKYIAWPNDSARLEAVEKVSLVQSRGNNSAVLSDMIQTLTSVYEDQPVDIVLLQLKNDLSKLISVNGKQECPEK